MRFKYALIKRTFKDCEPDVFEQVSLHNNPIEAFSEMPSGYVGVGYHVMYSVQVVRVR